jgi:hypothetical protein
MSPRRLVSVALIAAAGAGFVWGANRLIDRLYPADSPPAIAVAASADAQTSPSSTPVAVAPAATSHVVFFDGGYAVGPASEIELVLAARSRGTHTACEQPAPTPDERASWQSRHPPRRAPAVVDLLRMSDVDLAAAVSARLLDKSYGAGYAAMTREEQNVYLVYVLELEVVDGGLDGFFGNSAGNCATRTAAALEEVGLDRQAAALRAVLADFPDGGPSEDRSTRFDQLDALGGRRARWHRLDRELEGIATGTAGYIRAHVMVFPL